MHLTNGEFSVLVALLDSPPRILSRDQILDRMRMHNDEGCDRSVDTQIMRLQKDRNRSAPAGLYPNGARHGLPVRGAGRDCLLRPVTSIMGSRSVRDFAHAKPPARASGLGRSD